MAQGAVWPKWGSLEEHPHKAREQNESANEEEGCNNAKAESQSFSRWQYPGVLQNCGETSLGTMGKAITVNKESI